MNHCPHIAWLVLTATTVSCAETDKDDSIEAEIEEAYNLSILSPTQDASYESGELVDLSVRVETPSGDSAVLDQIIWETGSWTATGNNLTVSDLPDGSRALNVTVVSMGETFSASVDIHIGEVETGDTGAVDPTDGDFAGVIEAQIDLVLDASSGGSTYDDPCEGWVEMNIDAPELRGTGSCRAFGEDWDFDIVGTEIDGIITGNLSMQFEDMEPTPTPFEGTRDELDHLVLEFEGTHYPGEVNGVAIAYLTITGTITADPDLD